MTTEKNDYIVREIEKISLVIAKLMSGKINLIKDKETEQEVNYGLNLFNLSISEIKNNPPEKIFETIQNKDKLSLLINLLESIILWDSDISLVKFLQHTKTYINTQKIENATFYFQ